MTVISGARWGALAGLIAASHLIGLPVLLGGDGRQVEWLGNILFVAVPLILLGSLIGAAIGGASWDREQGGKTAPGVFAASSLLIVFLVLILVTAGTTNFLG